MRDGGGGCITGSDHLIPSRSTDRLAKCSPLSMNVRHSFLLRGIFEIIRNHCVIFIVMT